jgi:hypothetical protein
VAPKKKAAKKKAAKVWSAGDEAIYDGKPVVVVAPHRSGGLNVMWDRTMYKAVPARKLSAR